MEDILSMIAITERKTVIRHPESDKPVSGTILPPGTTLKESDLFNSPCGSWMPCDEQSPYHGKRSPRPTGKVVFVRPIQ